MKYKKTKLRPSVGFSLSKDFNDVVAVDLKPTNGIHILHIIVHATQEMEGNSITICFVN